MSNSKSHRSTNPLKRLLKGKRSIIELSKKRKNSIPDRDDERIIKLRSGSYLKKESKAMDRLRRQKEQQGHRMLGVKVHERYHSLDEQHGLSESYENNIRSHPRLLSQLWDGTDNNVSPPPSHADPEVRRKFDNKRNEQRQQQELRLGLSFTPSNKIKPRMP